MLLRYYALLLCLGILLSFPQIGNAQCPDNSIDIDIVIIPDENFETDNTRWELSENGHVFASGNADTTFCVPTTNCYTFTIFDDFGDGLSAGIPGYYSISIDGELLANAVDFGFEQSAEFGACVAGSSCWSPITARRANIYTVVNSEALTFFILNETN